MNQLIKATKKRYMTLQWCLTVVRLGMKRLTASVLMGGIASCRKIETEAEVEAEEVEVA